LKGLTSEGLVGAVAERTFLGMLAGAEVDCAVGLSLIGHGREGGAFVAAVAEGLVLTVSTRAPVVGLTGFNEDRERRLLRDMGCGHGVRVSSLEYGV
jgi:hypothetical protein